MYQVSTGYAIWFACMPTCNTPCSEQYKHKTKTAKTNVWFRKVEAVSFFYMQREWNILDSVFDEDLVQAA